MQLVKCFILLLLLWCHLQSLNFVLMIDSVKFNIENPETGEPTATEAIEDKLSSRSGAANSGCDNNNIMIDNVNSAYRAAGTQSSNDSALPTKDKPASELQANSGTTKEKRSEL